MPDTYVFKGSDGVERKFVGDRPPTPDEMTALEKAEAPTTKPSPTTSNGPAVAAIVGGTAAAIPKVTAALEEFGTNPAAKGVGAAIGRGIGAVTSLPGSLTGFGDMARGAYAGSRSGWFTTKLLQDAARPLARLGEAVSPYAEYISGPTLGAMGAEAEANSRLASEMAANPLGSAGFKAQAAQTRIPELIHMVDQARSLVAKGSTIADAIKTVAGHPAFFGPLMTAYLQSNFGGNSR